MRRFQAIPLAVLSFSVAAFASGTGSSGSCPVSVPNSSAPPGHKPGGLSFGNGCLWTTLWRDGTVAFTPGGPGAVLKDGSLAVKFPWWQAVDGNLKVEGRRLDASAPPLKAVIPDGYGGRGFQPTMLIFSTVGCWEVTGRVGESQLTFVTLVTKSPDRK